MKDHGVVHLDSQVLRTLDCGIEEGEILISGGVRRPTKS